jgi:hypothetical protein
MLVIKWKPKGNIILPPWNLYFQQKLLVDLMSNQTKDFGKK